MNVFISHIREESHIAKVLKEWIESSLASYFKMSEERMKYFLDVLLEHKMLNKHLSAMRLPTFSLNKNGRKLLVENNLL